jgi:peptidoglycan hydrolase-like protein with peptidoglycan-binding domain
MVMIRRLVAAVVFAAISLVVTANAAGAHNLPEDWSQGHAIGDTCGLTSGWYVKWLQTILWADNDLSGSGSGSVDGYFGPVTRWGVGSYQNSHSINPADGCAGYSTLRHMPLHRHYIGISGNNENYQYRAEKTVTMGWNVWELCWWVTWLPSSFWVAHGFGACT